MDKIAVGDIVRYLPTGLIGEVLDVFSNSIKIRTAEGEKTFIGIANFERIDNPDIEELNIYPDQLALKKLYTDTDAKNPIAGKLFRLLMGEMFKFVGWRPGDQTWRFTDNIKEQRHPALRVPTGRTSYLFHFWAWEGITVALEPSKKCPPEYAKYFPKKGFYYGGDGRDIDGPDLTEAVILEYVEVLKAIYKYNTNLNNNPHD